MAEWSHFHPVLKETGVSPCAASPISWANCVRLPLRSQRCVEHNEITTKRLQTIPFLTQFKRGADVKSCFLSRGKMLNEFPAKVCAAPLCVGVDLTRTTWVQQQHLQTSSRTDRLLKRHRKVCCAKFLAQRDSCLIESLLWAGLIFMLDEHRTLLLARPSAYVRSGCLSFVWLYFLSYELKLGISLGVSSEQRGSFRISFVFRGAVGLLIYENKG